MLSLSAFACSFTAGGVPTYAAAGSRVGAMMSDSTLRDFLVDEAVRPQYN